MSKRATVFSDAQLDNKQVGEAKANSIMYAIDKAQASVKKNPSLDFEKEAQYMFLSHYVDRADYYWATKDERLLLDGSTMSGHDRYLA